MTLTLKTATQLFLQSTPMYDKVPSYQVWLQKVQQFKRCHQDKHFKVWTVTVTLTTAIQYFHWTLWLMLIYHQNKSGCTKIITSEAIVETVIFSLYKPLLTLKTATSDIFSFDTPAYDDVSPHPVWLHKVKCSEDTIQTNINCTFEHLLWSWSQQPNISTWHFGSW